MSEEIFVYLVFNPDGERMNILANKEGQAWWKLANHHLETAPSSYYKEQGYKVKKFKCVEVDQQKQIEELQRGL